MASYHDTTSISGELNLYTAPHSLLRRQNYTYKVAKLLLKIREHLMKNHSLNVSKDAPKKPDNSPKDNDKNQQKSKK